MFKIGEFSRLMKISVRMLRYYDEVGLLKPIQVDPHTGYRLYAADQILLFQRIMMLRDLNFNVAEIKRIVTQWSDAFIIEQLETKKREKERILQLEKDSIAKIEMTIKDVREKKMVLHYNVTIKAIPSYTILSLRQKVANYHCEGMLWHELFSFIARESIPISPQGHHNLAIYHDKEHQDDSVDIEVGVVVKQLGENKESFTYRQTEEVDTMACMMVWGPYHHISEAYKAFTYWLEQHNHYKMAGLSRQICHKGPHNEENPDNFLTEIQIPVLNL